VQNSRNLKVESFMQKAFGPSGATVSLAVSAASARVALPARSIRLHNSSEVTMFIAFGDSAVSATVAAGMPIPAGGVEVFDVPGGPTHVAAITASGTGTLYVTPGQGL
jgi:hypothetical protein